MKIFLLILWAGLSGLVGLTQQFTDEELLGKFDPASHPAFVRIEEKYTSKKDIYLRKEAYDQITRMIEAAQKDGIQLTILSATRNFNYQKGIWERKWNNPKYEGRSPAEKVTDILRYSSMPGTSRHHWGTDVDFNSVELAYFRSGDGKQVYDWLCAHGAEYGFFQTYTPKSDSRTGYEEEPWHWSYMPLAGPMLKAYNTQISCDDLTGFKGSETACSAEVIRLYVNGIHAALLKEE